jgi:HesB-like selenoprotein
VKYITISEEGYKEFKTFLNSINFKAENLRIRYLGKKCSGPVFNIDIGIEGKGDIVEEVKDMKFIMHKELIDEYGGFIILSNSENNGQGIILKPVIEPVSGCSICPGC